VTVAPPVVRVLGPVHLATVHGPVAVGGPHPRALLAVVALDAGRVVPSDRIGDLLWGADHLPRRERGALQQTATRVRRAVRAADLGDALRAEPPGYRLDVDTTAVDALVFRAAVRVARDASRRGDHAAVVDAVVPALSMWHGRALAGLEALPVAAIGAILDDERWAAEELCCGALLATGRLDDAVDRLHEATAAEPLRERLWVVLVEAHVKSGRRDEAARAARTAVAVLTAELGVAPGRELATLDARLRDESVPPLTVGHHRVAASDARRPILDAALARAAGAAEHAARVAMATGSPQEAVRQWERALELAALAAPADESRQLELLIELGDAHNVASTDDEARAVFRRAAALARRLHDAPGLARAALGYCADHITFRPPPEQVVLLEEALAALGDHGDPALRSLLLSRLAIEVYWPGPLARSQQLADEAMREAARSSDQRAVLEAHHAAAFSIWTPNHTGELVEAANDHLAQARATGSRPHEHLAHRWLALATTELGDLASGRFHAAESLRLADELDHPPHQWMARCISAGHAICAGDLDEAERLAADALTMGTTVEPEVALDYVSLLIWTCRWLQGRLDEVAELVEAVAGTPGVDLPRRLGLAMTRAALGRHDDARELLDLVTTEELALMSQDASWYSGMTALSETMAIVPHRHAAWAAVQLEPLRDRIGFSPATVTGPVAHQLGVCLLAAGRHPEGLEALADAITIADDLGMPVFGARSRVELAERLAATDAASARVLAAEALEVARSCGLPGVVGRAQCLLAAP
jgi:SARP family transcriptional regulator, regulator of embCAB operon